MLDFNILLNQLKEQSTVLEIPLGEDFDFTNKDHAYVIESGSVLVIGEKNTDTGVSPTHTLEVYDPIGFAEAISARPNKLRFRQVTDLKLRKFDSDELRKLVDASNIFSKTVIKYSIGRIFGQIRGSSNLAFEEGFIDKNYELLRRRVMAQDDEIFRIGTIAKEMFFINNGSVRVVSPEMKVIADLGVGECFGESALFDSRPRSYTVIANRNTDLLVIDREQVEIEVSKEPPIVRLTVLLLIKRLEVMNNLRMLDSS
jgi:CRP-like cAMP-binding protein